MSAALFRRLTFLGTASGTPSLTRNVSSYCLSWTDGAVWMIDCGEGTQHQLLRCKDVSLGKLEKIFITHLHGDHCWGLPGLLCSLAMLWTPPGVVPNATLLVRKLNAAKGTGSDAAATAAAAAAAEGEQNKDDDDDDEIEEEEEMVHDHFSSRSQYLEIYGPPNTASFLRGVLRSADAHFGFQYRVNELVVPARRASGDAAAAVGAAAADQGSSEPPCLSSDLLRDEAPPRWIHPVSPGAKQYQVLATPRVTVMAAELDHRVTSIGYAVTEPSTPGALDMARVLALGVPKGPLLAKLKAGEPVEFPTAGGGEMRRVRPDEVVSPPIAGRTALLLGDTCNSDATLTIARGAEYVVHESTFDNAKQHLAVPRGHSTAAMAGAFAQLLGAKHLILTHFSARYASSQKDPVAMEAIRSEAQAAFALGPVFVADDFSSFDLSRKKREGGQSPPPQTAAASSQPVTKAA